MVFIGMLFHLYMPFLLFDAAVILCDILWSLHQVVHLTVSTRK